MPPKRKSKNGPKAKSKRRIPPRDDTPALPTNVERQVVDFVDGIDFDLHKENLDSLAAHVFDELQIRLSEAEEADCAAATDGTELGERLKHAISVAWHRQERAERAFALLDVAAKGVVIVEDMRRGAEEVMQGDDKVTEEDLDEMMQEIDQSGDGLLTKEDFYRLAIKINL